MMNKVISLENLGSIFSLTEKRLVDEIELKELILSRTASLQQAGVKEGSRVLLEATSTISFFTDLLALFELKATVIPYSDHTTKHEITIIQKHATANYLIHQGMIENFHNVDHDQSYALILYTSGTTGSPKGVAIGYAKLVKKMKELSAVIPEVDTRGTICLLPTSFGHGLIANSLFPLLRGARLFLAPPFDIKTIMNLSQIVNDNNITFMSSVPSLWNMVFAMNPPAVFSSLKRVHCASSPLSLVLHRKIVAACPQATVHNVYGLTELLSWICISDGKIPADVGNVGLPIGAVQVLIVDENSQEQPPEHTGEILINSESMFDGYLDDLEATAKASTGKYFKTGDIGKKTVRDGSLIYVGRKKNMIIRAGIKIYPEEIDRLFLGSGMVSESCSLGIPHPLWGEEIVAVVVMACDTMEMRKKIKEWIQERLSQQKCPTRWVFVDEIPKNNNGKIDVNFLRQKVLDE